MRRVLLSSVLLAVAAGCLFYLYSTLPDVSLLRKVNPRTTALMQLREEENKAKRRPAARQHVWVSYENISESLKRAVVISEDAAFFSHGGVDPAELKESFKQVWETKSFKRGGSTITMQLARNLYLSPAKNPLRKMKEILIAWQLEAALSKRRIFEIYLNVVELGTNIYGVEAAARHYFGKSAGSIDALEAATLAALLPNPRTPRQKDVLFRRNLVLSRLAGTGYINRDQYQRASQARLFSKVAEEPPGP